MPSRSSFDQVFAPVSASNSTSRRFFDFASSACASFGASSYAASPGPSPVSERSRRRVFNFSAAGDSFTSLSETPPSFTVLPLLPANGTASDDLGSTFTGGRVVFSLVRAMGRGPYQSTTGPEVALGARVLSE